MIRSHFFVRTLGFCVFLALSGSWILNVSAEPADYSVYPHLERTEYLDGVSHSVEAYSLWGRDFFALANEESNLHIFQVEDGEVVAKGIGPTVGLDRDVAIKDWYAFVSTNSGLTAVSVAVPETPSQVGFINLVGDCTRVVVSATHAFVARGVEGLAVVDITDPQNMSLVGTYGEGTHVKDVWFDGDRLGILNHQGFEILDVSVPENPVLLGSLALTFHFKNCVLQGNLAYVSSWFQVNQLDITEPAAITVLQVLPLWANERLEILGPELVLVGTRSLDFVDFASGSISRDSQQVGEVGDAAIIAGKIMAAGNNRLEVYEDGLHLNPTSDDIPEAGLLEPRDIVLGNILYGLSLAADNTLVGVELGSTDGLRWNLDLSSDGSPIRGMAHRGSTLVTVTALGDLSVVSVSRHEAVLRGSLGFVDGFYTPYNQFQTVAFLDDMTVVVLDEKYPGPPGNRNIRVVDLTNPEQPVQIGQYYMTLEYPENVMAADQMVVVASRGGYEIFDARDRLSLQSQGVHHLDIVGNASAQIHARDSWLYVLNDAPVSPIGEVGPERLDTWDLTAPLEPVLVHQLYLANGGDLVFSGDWAYQEESCLILDLSDPSAPAPAGNFSPPNSSAPNSGSVLASTDYIVTGDLFDGSDSYGRYLLAQGASGGVSAVDGELPPSGSRLGLEAVPNPFNPSVTLRFELSVASATHLEIYDLSGRLVADLGTKFREAGSHGVTWNGIDRQGRHLSSGVYLARLRTPGETISRKIVLVR
jgi:hypothetical protein